METCHMAEHYREKLSWLHVSFLPHVKTHYHIINNTTHLLDFWQLMAGLGEKKQKIRIQKHSNTHVD